MADMNSDNETALAEALITPILLPDIARNGDATYELIVHKSTSPIAICAMLNSFLHDQEISIEFQVIQCSEDDIMRMVSAGKGYYYLSETTIGHNAPTLSMVEETDRMVGFANHLNAYSLKIRQYVKQEFHEEQATNG
jgi:hypothetical protein